MVRNNDRLLIVWEEAALGRCAAEKALARLMHTHKGGLGLCMEDECPGAGPETCAGRQAHAYDAEVLATGYDCFLLPMLPDSLLQALLRADFEKPAAAVILCALFTAKPVSVLRTALYPEAFAKAAVPPGLMQVLQQKERQLQSLGVHIVSVQNLYAQNSKPIKAEQSAKKILVEADILKLVSQGQSELILSEQDVLTPLAADTAKEKKLSIVRGW